MMSGGETDFEAQQYDFCEGAVMIGTGVVLRIV